MGGESVGWEEVKLCLALCWQRAAREQRDGGTGGYSQVLDTLVRGGYGASSLNFERLERRHSGQLFDIAIAGTRMLLREMPG